MKNEVIKVCIYNKKYSKKPEGPEIARISNGICRNRTEIELNEFANTIGNNIYAFTPAVFRGERKASNLEEIQLLCLDFDNKDKKISYDEVRRRSEELDLPIAFAYETPSSNNCSRFRVIYRYFEPIVSNEFYRLIYRILLELFPEADQQTSDVCRMFFGGKRLISPVNYDVIYPERLFSSLYWHLNKDPKTAVASIKAFAVKTDIALINNTFKINTISCNDIDKAEGKILYNNRNSPEVFVVYYSSFTEPEKNFKQYKTRGISSNDLYSGCRLIRELQTGERWLWYDELWGILTNLVHISGGVSYLSDILDDLETLKQYNYNFNKWRSNIKQIKKYPYMPKRCETFCPYRSQCSHSKNIITTIKPTKFEITKKERTKGYISLKEARTQLYNEICNAIDGDDRYVHIIKAQTGIGKTEAYIRAISFSDKSFIVAAPTNVLKNEIYQRMTKSGIKAVVTPDLPEDLEQADKDEMERLYRNGNIAGYSKKLAELALKYESIRLYKKELSEAKKYGGNIVTTHMRLTFLFDDNVLMTHTIIIDEDIIDTIFNIEQITQGEIKHLLGQGYLRKEVRDRIKYYSKTNKTNINVYKKHTREREKYIWLTDEEKEALSTDDNVNINLSNFLNAGGTIANNERVCYAWINKLPAQKIILLSASVNEEVYRRIFEIQNRSIVFKEIDEVRYKGRIIQEYSRSYSRKWMKNNPEYVEKIRNKHQGCEEITFKAYKEKKSNVYFGVSEGKNGLSGKDIIILGTPFFNEMVYKLFAACLECDMKNVNKARLNNYPIEDEEYLYYFFTYADKWLKVIQIYFISGELEQSVGRARLLNNDCNVYVYSSLPVKQAEFVKEDLEQCGDTVGERENGYLP